MHLAPQRVSRHLGKGAVYVEIERGSDLDCRASEEDTAFAQTGLPVQGTYSILTGLFFKKTCPI